MPTPNMSDEELDSLFQRGAEAYPDDNHLAAWARMETKLNTSTTAQQLRQKVRRIFAAELLVLGLLLWQGYHVARSVTEAAPLPTAAQSASLASAKQPGTTASAAARNKISNSLATTLPIVHEAPGLPVYSVQPVPGPIGGVGATGATPAAAPQVSAASGRAAHAPAAPGMEAGLAGPRRRRAGAGLALGTTGRHATAHPHSWPRAAKTNAESPWGGLTPAYAPAHAYQTRATAIDTLLPRSCTLLAGALPLPDALAPVATHRPADSAATTKRRAARPPYRLVVGVLGAPSASAVRTAQTARLGGDFGLTLEYRLTSRLRVRSGLISSEKRYNAPSTDYVVPPSWQWFSSDYVVDASCRVTEIPVDLRYDVLSRPTYAVFASLGVNSLLMRDERYSYDWMQNGQTFTKSAHVVKGSHHLLSVLNFAVGLERPLGRRWSAQVEPFLQLPLGGVGAGQVRLSSAGAAFSLKFGLIR